MAQPSSCDEDVKVDAHHTFSAAATVVGLNPNPTDPCKVANAFATFSIGKLEDGGREPLKVAGESARRSPAL